MNDQTSHESSRIVVGVDGSPQSILALGWAQAVATTLGATITAVTAWHLETVVAPYAIDDWDPEAEAKRVLAGALAEAFGQRLPEGLTGECRRGRPAKILIEESENASMLIVGSRGHGGFAGMLLGSVSANCAEHASCPVLVVHGASTGPSSSGMAVKDTREPAGDR